MGQVRTGFAILAQSYAKTISQMTFVEGFYVNILPLILLFFNQALQIEGGVLFIYALHQF